MSTHDDDTQIIPAESNGHGAPSSAFDVLRAKRAEYVVGQTYDIDVPGYGGLLVIRCGAIASRQLSVLRTRFERSRSPERDFDFAADVLLAACDEVMFRDPDSEDLRSIEDEPVLIDERLAAGLDLDATSGRALVRQLFGQAPSPELALGSEVNAYLEWASSVNADVDSVFMGESRAAPR